MLTDILATTLTRQFKNICVLCGFHYGEYKELVQIAVDIGLVITKKKLHLVYGRVDQIHQSFYCFY